MLVGETNKKHVNIQCNVKSVLSAMRKNKAGLANSQRGKGFATIGAEPSRNREYRAQ